MQNNTTSRSIKNAAGPIAALETPIKRPNYQTYATIFADIPKPFAYVDLDQLSINAQRVLAYSGRARVRLGSKSIRCRTILRHILDSHARFEGILCFTAAEAVWLAQHGFKDLLVAYPTWEPQHVTAVLDQLRDTPTVTLTLMVDCHEQITHLNNLAATHGTVLPLCIDLDVATKHYGIHFGALRSPVREPSQVLSLAQAIRAASHLRLDGVMGYEGQIAGVADNTPGDRLARMKRHLKRLSMRIVKARRAELIETLHAADFQLRFVNAGGSGSLSSSSSEAVVDEVTAGSAFYCPVLFSNYADYDYLPAAGYAIEVVRRAAPDIYTCLGGGYVASGAAGKDRLPEVYLPTGGTLIDAEGAGEVQTPIRYSGRESLTLGSPIFMRHAKAGELCERFNQLYLIANGKIVDVVPTYRGEGQCIL